MGPGGVSSRKECEDYRNRICGPGLKFFFKLCQNSTMPAFDGRLRVRTAPWPRRSTGSWGRRSWPMWWKSTTGNNAAHLIDTYDQDFGRSTFFLPWILNEFREHTGTYRHSLQLFLGFFCWLLNYFTFCRMLNSISIFNACHLGYEFCSCPSSLVQFLKVYRYALPFIS